MARQRKAIGLDVGAQSIKMVCLETKGNSVYISDYNIKEYFQQGEEKTSAISEILKDIKTIGNKVPIVVSLEGASVFIRVFKLPGVTRSKLAKIVAYEAQQQVPFPIDRVVWAYQCLRRVSPEETDVVLAAVRSNIVGDFLSSLGTDVADIVPPVIGLNNFLSWGGYSSIQDPSGQAVMLLDLGARTTNVIIIEKQSLWFRTIPLGGEIVTQAISTEYNISYSEAELLKREKGEVVFEGEAETDPERKRMSTCIIKSLTRLTSEISRSIEVYSSSFNSLGPRKIFITGGGVGLKNIGEFFSKKFRLEVSNLQIDKRFMISDDLEKENFFKVSERLGTAIGLALHGLGFGKVSLSLLPKEILQKYKWLNRQAYITAVWGLLIFLGVCFSGYNTQMAHIYKVNVSRLENEKKAVDFNKRQIMNIQKEFDIVKSKMDRINGVRFARSFWLDMLLEIEVLLPNNVWLVGIGPAQPEEGSGGQKVLKPDYNYYSSGLISLRLQGQTTGTYQDIVMFRDALNNSKYFVKDTGQVVSANPPLDSVRDFVIEVEAKIPNG